MARCATPGGQARGAIGGIAAFSSRASNARMSTTANADRIHELAPPGNAGETIKVERRMDEAEPNKSLVRVGPILLCGNESKNGNVYTDRAKQDLARLYEGKPIAYRHSDEGQGRTVDDRNGAVSSARKPFVNAHGVWGYWDMNPYHVNTQRDAYNAEHFPGNLCVSHELPQGGYQAEFVRESDRSRKRRRHILSVQAVDELAIVPFGGTTRSLKEHDMSKQSDSDALELKTPDDLRKYNSELYDRIHESIVQELKHGDASKALERERDELKAEMLKLQKRLTEMEVAEANKAAEAKLDEMIADRGIPELRAKVRATLLEHLLGDEEESAVEYLDQLADLVGDKVADSSPLAATVAERDKTRPEKGQRKALDTHVRDEANRKNAYVPGAIWKGIAERAKS